MATKRIIVPGGIDEYIDKSPEAVQDNLKQIRAAIIEVVPDATETLSYFQIPGYHYEGNYAYNGMFAWFSYKEPFIRLHVYPEVIKKLKDSEGTDLQVHGSGDLIQTLMEHDLVNEYWLKIFPITLGRGKRLFDTGTIPASFTLLESKTSPSGVIFANFKRSGEVKTGSF